MLRRSLLLLVVLPLVGAAGWWAQFYVLVDAGLDRPYNLLPFVPLALPALIVLGVTIRRETPGTVTLLTAYSAALTIGFAAVLLVPVLALDTSDGCPWDRISC